MTQKDYELVDYSPAPDPDEGKPKKNLYQKLCDVVLAVGYIKNQGKHVQFKYTRSLDIRKHIREELALRGILVFPSVTSATQQIVQEGSTAVTHTQMHIKYTLLNAENPTEKWECDWVGWSSGNKAYAAYGCFTGAQRHFFSTFLMLLTGEMDPEEWDKEIAKSMRKIKKEDAAEESARAKANMERSQAIVNVVSTQKDFPTPEQMESIDPEDAVDHEDEEDPDGFDDYYAGIAVRMCEGLEKIYPAGRVGDIAVKHLVGSQAYINNVNRRVQKYDSDAHRHLAKALTKRLEWETKEGKITDTIDGNPRYQEKPK